VRVPVRVRVAVVLLVSVLAAVGQATGAGAVVSTGSDTGAVTLEADIQYPSFPCDFTASSCTTPVTGTLAGAFGGVHDGTPWAVDFDDAAVSANVDVYTLPVIAVPGFCNYENSRGPLSATTTSVTGTFGATPVTGVDVGGELEYLRGADRAVALAIAHLRVTLHTAVGDVVTVPSDQWAVGGGTWSVVAGAVPSDCTSLPGHAALTAHVSGSMAVTPQVALAS
jgi:hypothetical protein